MAQPRPQDSFRIFFPPYAVFLMCWKLGMVFVMTVSVASCYQPTSQPQQNANNNNTPPVSIDKTFFIPKAPNDCKLPDNASARTVALCHLGKGIFGFWHNQETGLPVYEYQINHRESPDAVYPHSTNKEAREHFHQVGNDRINAIAYNDGYLVLMGQERGVTFYNRWDPEYQNYAGGFSIIAEGSEVWNTAYRWHPSGTQSRRVFGMGYASNIAQYKELRITRHWIAPPGDHPFVLDEVEITNLSDKTRTLRHYEYWDINRHQLSFQPIRTGEAGTNGDLGRNTHNEGFDQQLSWKDGILQARYIWRGDTVQEPIDKITGIDQHPSPLFLATLGELPTAIYTNQAKFLGQSGITAPDGAKEAQPDDLMARHKAMNQPAALIMRHDLTLQPGETKKLRFAFGYIPQGKTLDILKPWRETNQQSLLETHNHWKEKIAYFVTPHAPVLSREVPWHAYYLMSATNYLDYYQSHVTSQGSAYLYLHGFDGAPRDQALFSMPLVYLRPELARANLKLMMGLTRAKDSGMSYSFHSFGMLENAIIHKNPSDLDIFFLLAMGEYLGATGDVAFLQTEVKYHPIDAQPPQPATGYSVLDHIRVAFDHLVNSVQRGPNGLIRIWDGDWSDGIVWENSQEYSSTNTIEHGESIPNTQMAVYALSRLAGLLQTQDAKLSQQMNQFASALKTAVQKQFTGRWFLRAWMRDHSNQAVAAGKDTIDLEAQPWGLIADILPETEQRKLAQEVYDQLDRDSPLGPTLKPGTMVWPAVSQLMTWAYTRIRPDLAWISLQKQTLATHADKFPKQWFGIWSAPDGLDSKQGSSWQSVATPMTDWPVMNMNPHAMFLLGTLRVAGVEPTAQGLRIQPTGVPDTFSLTLPLLQIRVEKTQLTGTYTPHNAGNIRIIFAPPKGAVLTKVLLQGKEQTLLNLQEFPATFTLQPGQPVSFAVSWKNSTPP